MLMLSFALNYNSAHFTWPLPHGPGPQHPWGPPTLGWTMGSCSGLWARLGTQSKGGLPGNRRFAACRASSCKKGGLGARCAPPKKLVSIPCKPSSGAPGVSRQSRARLWGSPGFRNCSNEPSRQQGCRLSFHPCFPASPSLNEVKQTRHRTLGQRWVPAGAAAPNQTGGGCFRALVGAGTAW